MKLYNIIGVHDSYFLKKQLVFRLSFALLCFLILFFLFFFVISSWVSSLSKRFLFSFFITCLSCIYRSTSVFSSCIYNTASCIFVSWSTKNLILLQAACHALCNVLRCQPQQQRREEIAARVVRELCQSESYWDRALFVDFCRSVLELFSRKWFKVWKIRSAWIQKAFPFLLSFVLIQCFPPSCFVCFIRLHCHCIPCCARLLSSGTFPRTCCGTLWWCCATRAATDVYNAANIAACAAATRWCCLAWAASSCLCQTYTGCW